MLSSSWFANHFVCLRRTFADYIQHENEIKLNEFLYAFATQATPIIIRKVALWYIVLRIAFCFLLLLFHIFFRCCRSALRAGPGVCVENIATIENELRLFDRWMALQARREIAIFIWKMKRNRFCIEVANENQDWKGAHSPCVECFPITLRPWLKTFTQQQQRQQRKSENSSQLSCLFVVLRYFNSKMRLESM